MPQFNHYETKSGRIIDPTFGLDALDAETKRKTKAREQMNTAAMVLRQSLGQRGKGLSEGTVATVSEGGGIEFTGDNAAADESRLYNTGTANYGKSGKGTTVKEAQKRDAVDALASQFNTRVAQANQSQAGMQAVGNNAIGAYKATTLNTTLPTNTVPGTQTPATLPTPVSPTTATILGGVLPPSLISPIYRPGVSAPLSNAQPAAPTASAATQQQSPTSNSMQAGTSVSFSSGGGTNSYSGSTEIDNTTESDIEVRDQLNMNQSDLAVNDAMQALAFHLSGGQSPGTFRSMMAQNADTMKTTNEALAKQGTSQTIRAGIGESQSSGAPNTSLSMSKEQRTASNSPGAQKPKNPSVTIKDFGGQLITGEKLGVNSVRMPVGGAAVYADPNKIKTIAEGNMKQYFDVASGSFKNTPDNQTKIYGSISKVLDVNDRGIKHIDKTNKETGERYISVQDKNGNEKHWITVDAMNPIYIDTKGNIFDSPGIGRTPMPKLTTHIGKYGQVGGTVDLDYGEVKHAFGQTPQD